jgi:hypothetical protein
MVDRWYRFVLARNVAHLPIRQRLTEPTRIVVSATGKSKHETGYGVAKHQAGLPWQGDRERGRNENILEKANANNRLQIPCG